jgi:hypothetical protein
MPSFHVVMAMHKSPAVAAAERRLEEAYIEWADSPEARELLARARAAFFASPQGARVHTAAVKAALQQLEPIHRAHHSFSVKSKEERQRQYVEWALAQPQWGDLLHRELVRSRAYRDAESQASQSLLELFEKQPEAQPLITDLLTAQREDRQQIEADRQDREAGTAAAAPPPVPPPLRAEKRAAKRARQQRLEERRAEQAQARDEHRLNWLAQHGRKSTWA